MLKTVSLRLDEKLNAALEALRAAQGPENGALVRQIVRRYVATEQLKRPLRDPALVSRYQQLAAEDVAQAEEGMAEYHHLLQASDHACLNLQTDCLNGFLHTVVVLPFTPNLRWARFLFAWACPAATGRW